MLLYVVMINLRAVFSWKFPWNFCAAFAPQWDIDDSGAVNCSCINSHYLPACYLVFQKVQHKDRLVIRSSYPSRAGVSLQVAGRERGETGADGPSAVSVQWFKTHFWNDKIVKSKTLLIPESGRQRDWCVSHTQTITLILHKICWKYKLYSVTSMQ